MLQQEFPIFNLKVERVLWNTIICKNDFDTVFKWMTLLFAFKEQIFYHQSSWVDPVINKNPCE